MKSPFPGMDPFLEGHLWADVHHTLAVYLKAQLIPQLSPHYLVQTEIYTVTDTEMQEDVGILYPDVSVLKEPKVAYQSSALTPPSLILQEIEPVVVKIPVLEIRDRKNRQLITAIEILSPVNKRKPGLEPYRKSGCICTNRAFTC